MAIEKMKLVRVFGKTENIDAFITSCCISGDFHAHASYRVSGNAAVTGQAAGILAALAAKRGTFPANVDYNDVIQEMER